MSDKSASFKNQCNYPEFDETIHTQLLVVGGGVVGTVAAVRPASGSERQFSGLRRKHAGEFHSQNPI